MVASHNLTTKNSHGFHNFRTGKLQPNIKFSKIGNQFRTMI
uniref:Uncharacterized protein n=1 Tax=Rhizophora mucronata TaxID=61149 RepID=A0A2P2N1L6_RHIMU